MPKKGEMEHAYTPFSNSNYNEFEVKKSFLLVSVL